MCGPASSCGSSIRYRCRRARQRDLGGRLVAALRQHQRLGLDQRRSKARLRLPSLRYPDQRLLRRGSTGRQPVCRKPGVPRRSTRRNGVVLPGDPHGLWDYDLPAAPPILFDMPSEFGRRDSESAGPGDQTRLYLRLRPHQRPADVADRGASGSTIDRTRRTNCRDAAVSNQTTAVRAHRHYCRRFDRLHAELRAEAIENLERYEYGPIFTPPSFKGTSCYRPTVAAPTGRALH